MHRLNPRKQRHGSHKRDTYYVIQFTLSVFIHRQRHWPEAPSRHRIRRRRCWRVPDFILLIDRSVPFLHVASFVSCLCSLFVCLRLILCLCVWNNMHRRRNGKRGMSSEVAASRSSRAWMGALGIGAAVGYGLSRAYTPPEVFLYG